MLPQVLAGLGIVGLLSAGCLLWLERLQPLFLTLAVVSLAWQTWLLFRRPPQRRSRKLLAIWWASVGTAAIVFTSWIVLTLRYR